MENKKSIDVKAKDVTKANDKKKHYDINEYSLTRKKAQELFFTQIERLYDLYVKGKNKFKFQNDIIEKFMILSYISDTLYNQLEEIKQYSSKLMLLSPCEIYIKLKNDKIFEDCINECDSCPICMDNFYDVHVDKEFKKIKEDDEKLKLHYNVIVLDDCQDHYFHINCLLELKGDKSFIKCPICFKIYGMQIGDQPEGTMIAYIDEKLKCSSYEKYDTITIFYHFPSGEEYTGTKRKAYLPANDDGYEILGLLKVCFDRKLTFKVGTSVTTGKSNTVVWSGIHHKSNITGGKTND